MKQLKQTFLLTVLLSMVGAKTLAYDIAIENDDGVNIYYNLDNELKTATVTYATGNFNSYSGDVNIPEFFVYKSVTYSVESIGFEAFYICKDLTSVTIPNSITSIGELAFCGCEKLTSVSISNGVKSIERDAFSYCSSLTKLDIPNSVTVIGDCAFQASGLTSIEIPNSVTLIGDRAFSDCSGLTSVSIPNSVTSIGDFVFYQCSGLTSPVYNSIYFIYMPSFYDGEYIIPNGINKICGGAFQGCTELTSLIIPNGVTSIGICAFYGCRGLASISIPNSVIEIGECAFQYCGLKYVDLPNGITKISAGTFINSGLISISIPNSVTEIGESAFLRCGQLTSISIPNSVTEIGKCAFQYCSQLTSISIPNSVTSIDEKAFSNCCSLTSLTISNSVKFIGNFAFMGIGELNSVTLETTDLADWCATPFTYIRPISGNHISLNGQIIDDLVIPNSVTAISDGAFIGCTDLKSITIPNSVSSIGSSAFKGCSVLTTLNIPNTITSIGSSAFASCSGLTSIKVAWNRPLAIDDGTFNDVDKTNCILYVPKGTAIMFMSAPEWMKFVNIVEYDIEDDEFASIAQVSTKSMHIKNEGGNLAVEGADDGEQVHIYTTNGVQAGSAISKNGKAVISTNLQKGEIAIVKVGEKSVKVVVK